MILAKGIQVIFYPNVLFWRIKKSISLFQGHLYLFSKIYFSGLVGF